MEATDIQALRRDFLQWSGGFEPESRSEITVYVDYACPITFSADEATRALLDWMQNDSADNDRTYP